MCASLGTVLSLNAKRALKLFCTLWPWVAPLKAHPRLKWWGQGQEAYIAP